MKDNQLGCGPAKVTREVGVPVVVMVKVPCVPVVKVVLAAMVIAGASATGAVSCTVNLNVCVALGRVPLPAVMVIWYSPSDPAAGVPLRVAVPVDLPITVTPVAR